MLTRSALFELFGCFAACILLSLSPAARAATVFGNWIVQLDAVPKADMSFPGHPTLSGLRLRCGENKSVTYRIVFRGQSYKEFDNTEGEGGNTFPLKPDGSMAPAVAAKFVADITPILKDYEKSHDKNQTITLTTPDMKTGDVNFFGFGIARASMKEACKTAVPPPAPATAEAAAPPSAPLPKAASPLTGWPEVQKVLFQLDQAGACHTGLGQSVFKFAEIDCSNAVGTRAVGRNGIYIEFHSVPGTTSQRVDQQANSLVLSSILIAIPSNLYTHVPPEQIKTTLAAILDPLGYGQYVPTISTNLSAGQSGQSRDNGIYTKWAFLNRSYGSVYGSDQNFNFIIIRKCGFAERQYPVCGG